MKTTTVGKSGVQGAAAKTNGAAPKTENRPSIPGKEKNDEPLKDQKPAEGAQGAEAEAAAVKTGNTAAVDNQPANAEQQPEKQELKAGEPKAEAQSAKPELTLEAKIKAVNDLHRKTIQRLALIARLKTLEEFEVKLIEEHDELESNPYQGCKLIIEDDKRRQFTTNTPGLVRMVAQFIFDACEAKLAEIEATINFPNA